MTLPEVTISEITNLIWAMASIIGALTGAWSVIVSKRGVAVSTRNETALVDVRQQQDNNKTDLKADILAVRHDIKNGGGEVIADKVVAKIKPALEETGKAITDQVTTQVAQTAANVAAVLAEKGPAWDGVERRVGPPDRRGR